MYTHNLSIKKAVTYEKTTGYGFSSLEKILFYNKLTLGTGIVRAYKTECCGVPGLRILLHPDLEPLLDKETLRIIQVKPSEKMHLNVQSEVNYLKTTGNQLGPDFDDCIQFDCLRQMIGLTDESLQYHYIETFNAWNLMRSQLGRAPYPWEKFLDRDEYDYTHEIHKRPSVTK